MRSVASINKITKAMKMVSAAKLRAVQRLLTAGRAFGAVPVKFYSSEKAEPFPVPKNPLMVPYTSDRGLCGAINSSVARVCDF